MDNYKRSSFKSVLTAENDLSLDILELKTIIEEAFSHKVLKRFSSFPLHPEFLCKDRYLSTKSALNVSGSKHFKSQGEILLNQLENVLISTITSQNFPLVLHQFFLDQMKCSVHLYHSLMLRWKRLSEHFDILMAIYPKYKESLDIVKSRYKDYSERANRLDAFNHSHLVRSISTENCLEPDDVAIFLRWLIVHLYTVKTTFCYLKTLQWLPISYRHKFTSENHTPQESQEVNHGKGDYKSVWKNMTTGFDFSYTSITSLPSTPSLECPFIPMKNAATFYGNISNKTTNGIPCHVVELDYFRNHLESLIAEYGIVLRSEIKSASDEMELFGTVNRHFKTLFNRQVECSTFYQYDNAPEGYTHWGTDSSSHCLKKTTNWIEYINIKPRYKTVQMQQSAWLKQLKYKDELLLSHNKFLDVIDSSLVTEALKEHAVAVRQPPLIQALCVTSNLDGELLTRSVWNTVYKNNELSDKDQKRGNLSKSLAAGDTKGLKQLHKKESYNYLNTLQMLGLDDNEDSSSQNPSIIQGSYLSFLYLRHLKIRDLKRQCLGCLNYFRSIERMITIYDGGLSKEGEDLVSRQSSEAFFTVDLHESKEFSTFSQSSVFNQSHAANNGFTSQQNIQDAPDQFKVDDNIFMNFTGIENHDDFYTLDSSCGDIGLSGRTTATTWKSNITAASASYTNSGFDIPHVQDLCGFYIVYDAALSDFENLENELLFMASYFIEKDIDNRGVHTLDGNKKKATGVCGGIDIASLSHQNVDRFAVLLDLWTCELNFLVHKEKLMNCFIESFHLIDDPLEKRNLSQIITDIIHQRPRYDLSSDYFVQSYQGECDCLNLKTTFFSQVLKWHMDKYKTYLNHISNSLDIPGMPFHCKVKQEISVNLPKPALKHVSFFQFYQHIGLVAVRLYDGLENAILKSTEMKGSSTVNDIIMVERQVLEYALHDWENMPIPGSSFCSKVQKELFADDFIENVFLVDQTIQSLYCDTDDNLNTNTHKMDPKNSSIWLSAIDAILFRHQLIGAAWETELISKLYKKAATSMGYDEAHFYLPPIQFEECKKQERIDTNPARISNFVVVDVMAKKFIPPSFDLAVRELDSNHLGNFSFQTSDDFARILTSKEHLKDLQISLACQITHKNSAIVAVTQSVTCALWKDVKISTVSDLRKASFSNKGSVDNQSRLSEDTLPARKSLASTTIIRRQLDAFTGMDRVGSDKQKRPPEPFISLQLEKVGPRSVITNSFVQSMETKSTLMSDSSQVAELKRNLVTGFCREVTFRMSLHAMRSQIIMCYSGILTTLTSYPLMRHRFFMVGSAYEKKRKLDSIAGMVPDPKIFQKRPRRVFSIDGKSFLNLWFIPHYTEVLLSFRNFDYDVQERILSSWLNIASALYDIVHHLCSKARLSRFCTFQCRPNLYCPEPVHWDEAEEIGSQLKTIQDQINGLETGVHPYTKDPNKVAEFLQMKKDILYSELDLAIRVPIREKFLSLRNNKAYQIITDIIEADLCPLNNVNLPSLTAINISFPKLLSHDVKEAQNMLPWLCFELGNGPYQMSYPQSWHSPSACMKLCFAGLTKSERKIAAGQLQEVSDLLQRVLLDGTATYDALEFHSDVAPKGFIMSIPIGRDQQFQIKEKQKKAKRKVSDQNVPSVARRELQKKLGPRFDIDSPLDMFQFPFDACRLTKTFLKVWKQLETFKMKWAKARLGCRFVNKPALHRAMNEVFRVDVSLPIYSELACRVGVPNLYYEIEPFDGVLPPPPGIPILNIKAELLKKLIEMWELRAITEARDSVSRQYRSLLLAEHGKSFADVFGQAPVAEVFGPIQYAETPSLVVDFVQNLMSESTSDEDTVSFDFDHLKECFLQLGSNVIQRERDDFTTYLSRYNGLLCQYDHMLEAKDLKTKASDNIGKSVTDINFQLADRSPELIMELTALRTKVSDMHKEMATTEKNMRNEIRLDSEDLIKSLFDACFEMKARLAEHHSLVMDDVYEAIADTRQNALKKISYINSTNITSTEEERDKTVDAKEVRLEKLDDSNVRSHDYLNKIRAFRCWQHFTDARRLRKKAAELESEYSRIRRASITRCLRLKEKSNRLFDDLKVVRRMLQCTDDKMMMKSEEKEQRKKWKRAKHYKNMMKKASRRTMSRVKNQQRDELDEIVQERSDRLHTLDSEIRRTKVFDEINQRKLKEALKETNTQILIEKALKKDAIDLAEQLESRLFLTSDQTFSPQTISLPTSTLGALSQINLRTRHTLDTSLVKGRPASCLPVICPPHSTSPMPKRRSLSSNYQLKKRLANVILDRKDPRAHSSSS